MSHKREIAKILHGKYEQLMMLRCVEGVYTGGYGIMGRGWPKRFDFGFSEIVGGGGGERYTSNYLTFFKTMTIAYKSI